MPGSFSAFLRTLQTLLRTTTASNAGLRTLLIRSTGGTFALRIFSRGLGFLTNVLLARLLDVPNYGAYTYAFSLLLTLTMPSLVGFDRLLVREFAVYRAQAAWGRMRGLLLMTTLVGVGISLLVGGLVFGISWLGARQTVTPPFLVPGSLSLADQAANRTALHTLWVMLLILPLNTLIQMRTSAMQGLQRVVMGQVPDLVFRPLLFIALVVGASLLLDSHLTAAGAMVLRLMVTVLAFIYGTWLLIKALPPEARLARPVYQMRLWLKSSLPMFVLSILAVLRSRVDVLLLGMLTNLETVALYGAALALSEFAGLILSASITSLTPAFAHIHAEGDHAKLERLVMRSTRMVMLASLPGQLLLVLFGPWLLSLFGPAYEAAYPALVIIVLGQVVNVSAGTAAPLLTMTGHEREAVRGMSAGVIVYVALCLLLIPLWGMEGAAVATAASMITWNVILVGYCWRRLRIMPFALLNLRRR